MDLKLIKNVNYYVRNVSFKKTCIFFKKVYNICQINEKRFFYEKDLWIFNKFNLFIKLCF